MTRDQIETVLKAAQAKQDKEGAFALPEGANVSFYVAHGGASLAFPKLESVKIDGELVYGRNAKQTVVIALADVFAVTIEGGGNQPRRSAGFTAS